MQLENLNIDEDRAFTFNSPGVLLQHFWFGTKATKKNFFQFSWSLIATKMELESCKTCPILSILLESYCNLVLRRITRNTTSTFNSPGVLLQLAFLILIFQKAVWAFNSPGVLLQPLLCTASSRAFKSFNSPGVLLQPQKTALLS